MIKGDADAIEAKTKELTEITSKRQSACMHNRVVLMGADTSQGEQTAQAESAGSEKSDAADAEFEEVKDDAK